MPAVGALLLVAFTASCGADPGLQLVSAPHTAQALNAPIELIFDAPIDSLRLPAGAIVCRDSDGRVWESITEVRGRRLFVSLVIEPAHLASATRHVVCRVPGGPGRYAVQSTDGRRLGRPREIVVPLLAELVAAPAAPRLVAVAGRAVEAGRDVELAAGLLTLQFDGVLDPATVTPGNCPLIPLVQGRPLGQEVLPDTSWRCIGQRFDLLLTVGEPVAELQLVLRRFAIRDPMGRAVEPPLVLRLAGS